MLDLLGSGYLIDHCLAQHEEDQKKEIFHNYIAECLRITTENTAKYVGGAYMKLRYSEIMGDIKPDTSEEKAQEEIKNEVLAHFGNKEVSE